MCVAREGCAADRINEALYIADGFTIIATYNARCSHNNPLVDPVYIVLGRMKSRVTAPQQIWKRIIGFLFLWLMVWRRVQ